MENKAAQMDKVYNPQAIEGELYKEARLWRTARRAKSPSPS